MRKATMVLVLSALVALGARADVDPEPPGRAPSLSSLRGKWTLVRRTYKGKDSKLKANTTYEFDGDKVTVDTGKTSYVAKARIDKTTRPATLEMIREDTNSTSRVAVKLHKGELFLALPAKKGNPKAKEDFSGDVAPITVFKRDRK